MKMKSSTASLPSSSSAAADPYPYSQSHGTSKKHSNGRSDGNTQSLNPNDYNPISTLEQQYAHAPLGRRIILVIQLNEACIVPGGLDTVLKSESANVGAGASLGSDHSASGTTSVIFDPSSSTTINDLVTDEVPSASNLMNSLSLSHSHPHPHPHSQQSSSNYNHGPNSNNKNPFDFLHEQPGYDQSLESTGGVGVAAESAEKRGRGGRGSNFKSVSSMFAKAKHQFDRGLTSIAVQAHKAATGNTNAEIRDIITVGAYAQTQQSRQLGRQNVNGNTNGEYYDTCLGMTERYSMPSKPTISPSMIDIQNNNGDAHGITFQIPIILPPDIGQQQHNKNIQFCLWMRSGAAIFAKNRALRRYYNVGTATLPIAQLIQTMQPKLTRPILLNVPVQSNIITNGMVSIIAIPDQKFPQLCGNGWSLSDPWTDTAYTPMTGKKMLFNPPLDQNYIYVPKTTIPSQLQSSNAIIMSNNNAQNNSSCTQSSILLCTERTTESTLVLPLAIAYTELVHKAAQKSTLHSMELTSKLQCLHAVSSIHDPIKQAMELGHAQVQVEVCHFLRYPTNNHGGHADGVGVAIGGLGSSVNIMVNFQRPDSIFEDCIANGMVPSQQFLPNATYSQNPSISVPFYPRVVLASDPRLLPGEVNSNKTFHVGKLRFEICEQGVGGAGADVFSPIGPAGVVGTCSRRMEAMVDIDTYLNKKEEAVIQALVVDLKNGSAVGILLIKIAASTLEGMVDRSSNDISNSVTGKRSVEHSLVEGGLISFVGLDTMMEDDKACYPHADLDSEATKRVFAKPNQYSSDAERRKRQIAIMGEFLSYGYMNAHTKDHRMGESNYMNEKFEAYKVALFTPTSGEEEEEELTPDKRRDPRPFRPSSSRKEPLLSSIGFNVHDQTFSITKITVDQTSGRCSGESKGVFKNITHGAPSDHFRGFGDKDSSFSGGLRRLEALRVTTAQYVRDSQDQLIQAVVDFFSVQSKSSNVHLPGRSTRHVPPSNHDISALRTACIAATQKLHTLTWKIAVRRSNVFSQALGIGLSSYISHISDKTKLDAGAWAELWKKHGFLLCFEGLLSAAGKELGMIEDAAVGIAMLRMVSVVFVTEQKLAGNGRSSSCIPVPDSPYIKWVRINPSGHGTDTKYLVEICLDASFYEHRIPSTLKGNIEVQFYPVLFEMGVDIRQWGSNATKFNKGSANNEELDDDEVGVPDNDVLIALNYEAYRKMNAYAHSVYRFSAEASLSWEEAHSEQQAGPQPTHDFLTNLYDFIRSSAGKMEHGILDEAAHVAAKLGGGAAVFCKSGKDRTAMQVTFKQAQFINRFLSTGDGLNNDCELDNKKVFQDATIMRVYGTRLPICDKNVGQSLFAFNSLQARFMPDALKPPARALAGFLKGGRLFSGEPLIES